MDAFNLKKHFSLFDFLKSKGLAVSSLLNILIILPFYGVASIYALYKSGMKGNDFQGQKDAYYDSKNNENIDWRLLMKLHVKRFRFLVSNNVNLKSGSITAMIFDDTFLEKTGKKMSETEIAIHQGCLFLQGYLGKFILC